MVLENFRFFALHHLNDWCSYDRHFVDGMKPQRAAAARMNTFPEYLTNYGSNLNSVAVRRTSFGPVESLVIASHRRVQFGI